MHTSLSPNARSGCHERNAQPDPGWRNELYLDLDEELNRNGTIKVFPHHQPSTNGDCLALALSLSNARIKRQLNEILHS
jgi:hypothetical protein